MFREMNRKNQALTEEECIRILTEELRGVLSVLGDAPVGEARRFPTMPLRREGFVIPAEIGFAAQSVNLNSISKYTGCARVAGQILTFGYLWNEIRVVGGAYGTGLSVRPDGDLRITTYRDPSPARSLAIPAPPARSAALRRPGRPCATSAPGTARSTASSSAPSPRASRSSPPRRRQAAARASISPAARTTTASATASRCCTPRARISSASAASTTRS